MSIVRTYQRKCDGCGVLHEAVCASARGSIAAARRSGWQRRNTSPVITHENGHQYQHWQICDDLCPACLDKMEPTP